MAYAARRRAAASSTPATAGNSSCVALDRRGPRAGDLRSRHRPSARTVSGSVARRRSTVRCCSRTCTGTTCRACRSSCRCTDGESSLDIYGPRQDDGPLGEVFAGLMRPPYFPIRPISSTATVRFHDTGDDDFPVGQAKVRSRWVRHVGPTLGYRVDLQRRVGRVHLRPRAGLSRTTPTTSSRRRSSSCATASTC